MRKVVVEVPDKCGPECPLFKERYGFFTCVYRARKVFKWYLKPIKACRDAEITEAHNELAEKVRNHEG